MTVSFFGFVLCRGFVATFMSGLPFDLLSQHKFMMSRHKFVDLLYNYIDISL